MNTLISKISLRKKSQISKCKLLNLIPKLWGIRVCLEFSNNSKFLRIFRDNRADATTVIKTLALIENTLSEALLPSGSFARILFKVCSKSLIGKYNVIVRMNKRSSGLGFSIQTIYQKECQQGTAHGTATNLYSKKRSRYTKRKTFLKASLMNSSWICLLTLFLNLSLALLLILLFSSTNTTENTQFGISLLFQYPY